jgi:hypothetical protein
MLILAILLTVFCIILIIILLCDREERSEGLTNMEKSTISNIYLKNNHLFLIDYKTAVKEMPELDIVSYEKIREFIRANPNIKLTEQNIKKVLF